MKPGCLLTVLIAISGCSMNDPKRDLDACAADSMKTPLSKVEKKLLQRSCMLDKGYEFVESDACGALQIWNTYGVVCFRKR